MNYLQFILFTGMIVYNLVNRESTPDTISNNTLHANINPLPKGINLNDYILVKQDDFNRTSLDTTFWDYRQDGVFRDSCTISRKNVSVSNGMLRIASTKIGNNYYGAMISTVNSFSHKYG